MALPSSGQISMGDINVELGRGRTTSNTSLAGGSVPVANSLFGLASGINKTAPHAISEFYGYTHTREEFGYIYGTTSTSACASGLPSGSYYHTDVGNTVPSVGSTVYTTSTGAQTAASGFYQVFETSGLPTPDYIQVGSNGVVTSVGQC